MPKILETGMKTWENRHHTFTEEIDNLFDMWNTQEENVLLGYTKMSEAIQAQIGDAIRQGKALRALGGGWTWTRIATCHKGRMYNTKGLNWRFSLAPSLVDATYAGNGSDLLFVQCGVSIHELNQYLKRKGRSLKTSGASNGQTIAGALSTGTHGSAFNFGAVQEFVVGLHIITGPDPSVPEHNVYIERASYRVTKAEFAAELKAKYIPDDELFNAALVSFGSFGFIHGVLIETEPLYLLECYRQRETSPALRSLLETLDFTHADFLPYGSEPPHHFQVAFNPHDMAKGAYVSTMYKRPFTTDYTPPEAGSGIGPGDDAPAFIGLVSDAIPASVPLLVNTLLKSSYKTFQNVLGTRGEIFGDTDTRGKVISSAMGIPMTEVNRVLNLMLELNDDNRFGPFAGIYALRFVKATGATLGFTHFAPQTCVLELDCVYSPRMLAFIKEAWRKLEEAGIPHTFHWGKECGLDNERMIKAYGQARVDSWKKARRELLPPDVRKAFDNEQITEWGLNSDGHGEPAIA
jgi:FAD/FMN-containing dehydrogenase